jgi:hypothetical protein
MIMHVGYTVFDCELCFHPVCMTGIDCIPGLSHLVNPSFITTKLHQLAVTENNKA